MTPSLMPAARYFLDLESTRAPDFSGCLILVPHHHAGQAFRLALRSALPDDYFRPPRLLTLPELADTVPHDRAGDPDSLRLALLHDFLARTRQLPPNALWPAARELLALLDEMDAEGVTPPDLTSTRQDNHYLSLEAGIAKAVWRALGEGGSRIRRYQAQLSRAAAEAASPLYVVGMGELSRGEQRFLQRWRERQPVVELPDAPPLASRSALLQSAWQADDRPLAERAVEVAQTHPDSPLQPDLSVLAAPGLEAAAQAAESTLLRWLSQGKRQIAVIALDRLLARRLRALMERRGILMQDETGWAFSTASASHVLERWLALVTRDTPYRDLLDLLKSPFVFADVDSHRARAIHDLEDQYRRHGAPDDLAGHLALARQSGLAEAQALLARLRHARAEFPAGPLPMHGWMTALLRSLAHLGAISPLSDDPIGQQLLTLLQQLVDDTAGLKTRFSMQDWRQWLFLHLEQTTFSDDTVESPIRLTHLAAAHHRDLEGVVVLGAGAAQLPSPSHDAIFNDAARRQLGLPDTRQRERATQAMLADIMARTRDVALIWQSTHDGDPAPLSPWLVHLDAFHRAAWGTGIITPFTPVRIPPHEAEPAPAVFPSVDQAPARISVSAWQSLVSCPYQFYGRHLLGLNEPDEVPEEMGKADYGSLVHKALARFHRAHPELARHTPEQLREILANFSREAFSGAEANNYQALVWHQRWVRQIPAYVDWAVQWESAGHRFQSAEVPLAKTVQWAPDRETRVEGRADRLDAFQDQTVVLDYKTQSRQTLRAKLAANGEDVQLATYAWLADAERAGFVCLDDKKVADLSAPGDQRVAAAAEAGRIRAALAAMAEGHPLPAHGAPSTCAWCEMRGLCRRDYLTAGLKDKLP